MGSRYITTILLVIALSYGLAACAPPSSYERQKTKWTSDRLLTTSIIEINQQAADNLLSNCNIFIDNQESIIVTSLVNINDMKKSSTMGRMSSEIIANRLAQHGYKVHEVKMGQNLFVGESQGEFILSRELQEIGKEHDVQGFIVGTYGISERRHAHVNEVLISLRLVDADNIIGCSYNYVVRNTDLNLWR